MPVTVGDSGEFGVMDLINPAVSDHLLADEVVDLAFVDADKVGTPTTTRNWSAACGPEA
ncbi:hypothetical protein [Umezawaea sp.]|uniref:hypothetical protein n=1 Tax=Umezawaea sp. TaxID=1955258 RepID=UPI002ED12328